jgi:hypothetical protein
VSRLVALGLILAGALAVGAILLFDKSPKSASRTPTTHIGPMAHATHSSHAVSGISASQLNQFRAYSAKFETANLAAARGFDSSATTPTSAQLALVDIQYGKDLATYNNDLASTSWPSSVQSAIRADHAQLLSLMSFLRSFSIVQPSGVSAWLAQLHNRTAAAQTTDNQVRQDLGLPITTAFP